MKVVILAGGLGTRLSEETTVRPKPLVEIGGKPVLWHIMKTYSYYGFNEFVICLGYKGYMIKEYFANYFMHVSDVTFDLARNAMEIHNNQSEPWIVTLVDTGEKTMTGGRLRRVAPYVQDDEAFCFTYGDGVGDVNIKSLVEFHFAHGLPATVTATRPPGRFGALALEDSSNVIRFDEKPDGDGSWINGGFFVLSPDVLGLIDGDHTTWEESPLKTLAMRQQIKAYMHDGFWQPMDTLREKNYLNEMWDNQKAPWKIWS